ncbi:MAG TPA: nucleoside-diphosphate kinase [Candidatus Bilamarchaeaceae archaeon]|nr:nucleoside-diphosphate kinase [Candidatus Bilamarchaeaceae archaeon]
MERTLVLLKPDALQRGLIGRIITRFEEKGLKIIGLKMMKMPPALAKEHYAHLTSKPFYPGLEQFMTHNPIVAMCVEGVEAVEATRSIVGATNARKAGAGTIRGDFSMSTSRNVIHASDSLETAKKEVARFFREGELFAYPSVLNGYFYAEDELE